MTARDDELTTQLNHELHDRVDTITDSPLTFGDVRGKAHSIRRRRTAISVVAAAAAVAVIVPTAAFASHHVGGNSHSLPPATQNVTPTPSTTPPTATTIPDGQQPAPGVLDVSDLPTGVEPRMSYVTDGHVLHQVDGSTLDIGTRHAVVGFVSMYDGSTVWQTSDGQNPYVEVQDASGNLQAPVASGWDLAVNVAHTAAAWVSPDGQVMVWRDGAAEPTPLGDPITAGTDLRIGAVTGACDGPDCTVYVNVADASGASSWQPWEVTASGSQRLLDGSFLSIADESDAGLTIGLTRVTDFGTCSKLAGGGEFQGFSTCKHKLESFSPNGSLVLAGPAYGDGIGSGVIAMYDVGSSLQFKRQSGAKTQSFYPEAQWENNTHALAPVFQDGQWAIVRFASDGSMEYAVPPVKGDMDHDPYVLATDGMSYGD
jgi:hypothetical protein